MTSVDVFVGNNFTVDTEVYQLWLNGFSRMTRLGDILRYMTFN